MTVRLSNLALDDLGSIHAYTHERWGAEQAERYTGMLWDAMESLSGALERWRLRGHVHPGCRICLAGQHPVLYRVRDGRARDRASAAWHDEFSEPRPKELHD